MTPKSLLSRDEAAWACPDCSRDVEPFEWAIDDDLTHFISRQYCTCAAGQAKQIAHTEALKHDEWQTAARQIILPLDVGQYAGFRFSTWNHSTKGGDPVALAVEEYADNVEKTGHINWLYLSGGYGLGKTHLAVAALRKVAAKRLWQPHIVVWPELCDQTKESWQDNKVSEANLWAGVRAAQILLIDDLDKTATSQWAMSKLFSAINYRSTRQKPTIITANRSIKQLQSEWQHSKQEHVRDTGMAVLSRIVGQAWRLVEFNGQDQRWVR